MSRATTTLVGPEDHGRRMPLAEFEHAEAREGYRYELSRGVITVIDVPKRRHMYQMRAIRKLFSDYELRCPGEMFGSFPGNECKILLAELESERHPDLAIYKTPPPEDVSDEEMWATWIPEIVLEVVSPGSEHRDYVEKREEYLQFGVRENWIVDYGKRRMLVLKRSRGTWAERPVNAGETYKTDLLPGFEFDCGAVFEAADSAGRS